MNLKTLNDIKIQGTFAPGGPFSFLLSVLQFYQKTLLNCCIIRKKEKTWNNHELNRFTQFEGLFHCWFTFDFTCAPGSGN